MNKILLFLTVSLAATAAFAGCHEPEGTGPDDDGDLAATQITLTVLEAPDSVQVGETFSVTVQVEADGTVTSSHFGAHYGNSSSAEADPAEYTTHLDKTSPHVLEQTEVPDPYEITGWSFSEDEMGTIYFRAHVRTAAGDFWGDEHMIEVTAAE